VKTHIQTRKNRIGLTLIATVLALLLTLLLLSRFQALAQPEERPEIQKTVNTTQAGPGDTLTYTIHAWRVATGPPVYDAWITDTLATELTGVSGLTATYGDYGFDEGSGVITWTGDLGEVWITYSVQISPQVSYAIITNTAEITGSGIFDTSSAEVEVKPGELQVSKHVSPSIAGTGDKLTYTVHITNTGYAVVETAWMTDELPSEVCYAGGFIATTGTGGAAGNVITWTGRLEPLEAVTINFAAQITAALSGQARVTNTAQITGAGTLVTATARVTGLARIYLPLIFRNYPPIPVLNPIPEPDANGSYTVSWELDSDSVDHYVLQESASSGFNPVTRQWEVTGTAHSKFVEDGATQGGVLYYRVRADDGWGEGPWSNVESVSLEYYDEFDDPNSGWPNRQGQIYKEAGVWDVWWHTDYKANSGTGEYRIKIDLGPAPPVLFYQPDALAPYEPPTDKYCVETSVKFLPPYGWWANAGLVFGASGDNEDLYILCLDIRNEHHTWFVMRNKNYKFPKYGCADVSGQVVAKGDRGTTWGGWNRLQVSVDGNDIEVYVGGIHVAQRTMSDLHNTKKVGVIGGDYETSKNDIRFDYFRVIPNRECTP